MANQRIIVVDLCSLGLGEAPDANRYDSVGADSLGHVASATPDFLLPLLTRFGLGNVRGPNLVAGVSPMSSPQAYHGRVHVALADWTKASGFNELWQGRADEVLHRLTQSGSVDLINLDRDWVPALNVTMSLSDATGFSRLMDCRAKLSYLQLREGFELGLAADVTGYATWLRWVDHQLEMVHDTLQPGDWLLVTSTIAVDPTLGQLTREYVPLFVDVAGQDVGSALGIRRTLADISATIISKLLKAPTSKGHPFLFELSERNHHTDGREPLR